METLVDISEIPHNLALTAAAAVGAWLAWKKLGPETTQAGSAVFQATLARRAHVMELFNRAAGQLGDEKMEVPLAAIYILGEITDFPIFRGRCSSCYPTISSRWGRILKAEALQ
ncbi:hypothetical protein [Aurantimonas sp. VKM B-3413]|uniref:hypothetical protein n=1 Tax=Aurantimonas sp. VKM B-3413 TaxID=2779401 RepID=UPI001E3458DD|nr:hypothetical protein [Aurantimonas sp. VKM B-3413]MCB8840602.1 hypothetical protein [Aurantimonas sp. VKM B-3413]